MILCMGARGPRYEEKLLRDGETLMARRRIEMERKFCGVNADGSKICGGDSCNF